MATPAVTRIESSSTPMGVLLAMPWDQHVGGVTHVVATLAQSLIERGHNVHLLFPQETGFSIRKGTSLRGFPAFYCRLRNFPARRSSLQARISWYSTIYTTLPQLVSECRRQRINVVNVHYPGEAFALLVDVARALSASFTVSVHGSDILADDGPRRSAGLLRQFKYADAIVAPSQNFLRNLSREYPSIENKIRCVYNGYDEAEIPGMQPAGPPADQSELNAVCIAALIPKKGIDVLIRALKRCRAANLKLRLIGEGQLQQELESLSASLGLSDRIRFLGGKSRSEVLQELQRCDFTVLPSRHASESFGLAALEAMAFGKPVIASAIGGLLEVVDHDATGFLVPPDDDEALARALDRLADDPALRTRLGATGRSRAKQFTVKATADAYEALFRDLAAKPRLD